MSILHSRTRIPGLVDSSSLFLPTDVDNLRYWFDASQQTGLVDDDLVSTWNCVNNSTWNATASGAARPVYKTNIINGKPVIRFSGSKQLDASPTVKDQKFTKVTWFIVMSRVNAANNDYILGNGNPYTYLQYGNTWYYSSDIGGSNVEFPADVFKLKCAKYDGTNVTLYTNGSQSASIVTGVSCYFSHIGGSSFATNFDIAEILCYDRDLNDTERSNIEVYMNNKYALW